MCTIIRNEGYSFRADILEGGWRSVAPEKIKKRKGKESKRRAKKRKTVEKRNDREKITKRIKEKN